MNRILSLILLGSSWSFSGCAQQSKSVKPYNVLMIAVDDLRPVINAMGVEDVITPHLDDLIKESIYFKRAYSQYPSCSPSRASILSGFRPESKGLIREPSLKKSLPDHPTLPKLFKNEGYFAASIGKIFHDQYDKGDVWDIIHDVHWTNYALSENRDKKRGDWPLYELEDLPDDAYPDGQTTHKALETLEQFKDSAFFMAVGFYKPHIPFAVPKSYWDLYQDVDFDIPLNNKTPEGAAKSSYQWTELANYEEFNHLNSMNNYIPRYLSEEEIRKYQRGYYATVSFIDAQIGKIIQKINELGLADNTIICLWSDHGVSLGEQNIFGKHALYESTANVPVIIRYPGAKMNGKVSDSFVELIDIYPTLADLSGISYPQEIDGLSMSSLIDGTHSKLKDHAITTYWPFWEDEVSEHFGTSLVTEEYRYTLWQNDSNNCQIIDEELYLYDSIRTEIENVSNDPGYKGLLDSLRSLLMQHPHKGWKICHTDFSEQASNTFYLGADLSYVNEMDDCGAQYFENGQQKDVYEIFSEHQANIVRYRLWHDSDSVNGYSFLSDVKRAIARAKKSDMKVMLDFHYSDMWADPGRQWRPRAWNEIDDDFILADSVYKYTYKTLEKLYQESLLPEFVQIGNETNGNILQKITTDDLRDNSPNNHPVDWDRQVDLLQHGINAVIDFNENYAQDVKTIIHIAQPENIDWWFTEAFNAGLKDFDVIGLSYYPRWSDYTIRQVGDAIASFKKKFNKEVMIVEVAYPWIGGNEFFATRVNPHTPQDQKDFMIELSYLVKENGGLGVVYWEPAWVDTQCETLWVTGSTHDEYLFFDSNNQLLPAIEFFEYDYSQLPAGIGDQEVTFKVDMTGEKVESGVYVAGDFTGDVWELLKMNKRDSESDIYELVVSIPGRTEGSYAFYQNNSLNNEFKEPVPNDCSNEGNRRSYIIQGNPVEYHFAWGKCYSQPDEILAAEKDQIAAIYPNPSTGIINLNEVIKELSIWSMDGRLIERIGNIQNQVDVSFLNPGSYIVQIPSLNQTKKLIIK